MFRKFTYLLILCQTFLSVRAQFSNYASPSSSLKPLTEDEKAYRKQFWSGDVSTMVDMVKNGDYGNFYLPKRFLEIENEVSNLEIRYDDLFLVAYPKVGTTLAQEMIWQLSRGVDLEGGKTPLFERFPFLELESLVPRAPGLPDKTVDFVKGQPSPRLTKSHLRKPYLPKHLPGNAKVIVVLRNPKDVCVSYYFHEMLLQNHGFNGTFEQHAEFFLEGQLAYGSFWAHARADLDLEKQNSNVLLITYEQMIKDLKSVMINVQRFMNYPPLSEEQFDILKDHLSFNSFRNNTAVNMEPDGGNNEASSQGRFIRKGVIGDWKNFFSQELSNRFDAKTHQYLGDTGFVFEYE
ncbi:sulfotransferase 1E1 [Lepeophtheirus salmonis]|uniref:sulfotransferase 1E1 n=1 Tax=Lepeophtheirus salmonis TaxID=72036 RepID=UPI001AE43A53|nr:luciferin sulfotransferase-like [Lepeophtheirus salmonis]